MNFSVPKNNFLPDFINDESVKLLTDCFHIHIKSSSLNESAILHHNKILKWIVRHKQMNLKENIMQFNKKAKNEVSGGFRNKPSINKKQAFD